MLVTRIVTILLYTRISASVLWTKSSKIGINKSSDILHTESVSSKIKCAILCTNNVQCKSYQYEISIKLCTMLSKPHQSEPFTDSSETQHFGTQHIIECSVGYHLLPSSNVCVKLYPNYLSWNDSVAACINEGAGLPILNTDIIYSEFRVYLDNVSNAGRKISIAWVNMLKTRLSPTKRKNLGLDHNFAYNGLPTTAPTKLQELQQVASWYRKHGVGHTRANRVAVNGYMENFIPYWSNGELVDVDKFCVGTPDEIKIANNICLFMTHSSENWCGSDIARLDDASCDGRVLRICMEREE